MKFSILFLFLLVSTNKLFSEEIFEDKFDTDKSIWWTGKETNFSGEIKDGKYTLDFTAENQFKVVWSTFNVFYEKDFSISADFKQISGIDNHGYGLIWGTGDIKNLYYFIVSGNGMASIYKNHNNNWIKVKEWTSFSAINKMNNTNKLEISQINKRLHFKINNEQFLDTIGLAPLGNYIGFTVNNTMKVEIDNFTLKYHKSKIKLVDNPVKNTQKINLGTAINSKYSEIAPVISYDGNEIYFTRKNDPDNLGKDKKDDILYSRRGKDGKWEQAVRLGPPLNNEGYNSVVSISSDGNSLLLMNQYSSDGKSIKGGGISKSYKTSDGWSIPEDITINNYYNNQPDNYENQFLSADNKILLIAAQRNDSYGDQDLYVSFFDGTKYSTPLNLGPVVNTHYGDFSPYLAADGKTLYFASSGHPGYGSSDIFITQRLDDSWTNWSEPLNLGDGINTAQNDAYFVIPASGEFAYMMTGENTIGLADIIRVELNAGSKPEPVVLIYGKVLDSKSNKPLSASIKYGNLQSDKELGTAYSEPSKGEYKIVLPYGQIYSFLASKDGFYSISENIDLTNLSEYKEIEKNLYLTPIETGSIFRLNNVFFDYNKSTLRNESFPELNRLVKFLTENPQVNIEISGHTDNQGGEEYNIKLSKDRAGSVFEYLSGKGINKSRLVYQGYGKNKPIADNSTEEGRQLNRRVEVKILNR